MLISDLKGLTVRTVNVLKCENIFTLGELLTRSHVDLLKIPNMGRKSAQEIANAVQGLGFQLPGERVAAAPQHASATLPSHDVTLRDYFAAGFAQAQATATSADSGFIIPEYVYPGGEESVAQKIARISYELADAMLAARSA